MKCTEHSFDIEKTRAQGLTAMQHAAEAVKATKGLCKEKKKEKKTNERLHLTRHDSP